jgi:hypothetical protein
MRKIALVVFLVALALPAGAQAMTIAEWMDQQPYASVDLSFSPELLATARAPWTGSPCAGREVVAVVPNGTLDDVTGVRVSARAFQDGSCRLALTDRVIHDPVRLCFVLMHEFGHLAGRDHSDNPADVMYGQGFYNNQPACGPVSQYVPAPPAAAATKPHEAKRRAKRHVRFERSRRHAR